MNGLANVNPADWYQALGDLFRAQSDYEDTRGRANPLPPDGVDAADRMREAAFALYQLLNGE